jgi:hypothetical protein
MAIGKGYQRTEPGVLLTGRQLREYLGLSTTTFAKYRRIGAFDHLEAPFPNRYSKLKVDKWLLEGGIDEAMALYAKFFNAQAAEEYQALKPPAESEDTNEAHDEAPGGE